MCKQCLKGEREGEAEGGTVYCRILFFDHLKRIACFLNFFGKDCTKNNTLREKKTLILNYLVLIDDLSSSFACFLHLKACA